MTGPRGNDRGFTLVELMAVVLIIGILITIAIPVYTSASASAQMKSCQANQRTIAGVIALMASVDGATPHTAGVFASGGSSWYDAIIPSWIKNGPSCPSGGTYYLLDAAGAVVGDQGAVAGFKPGHQAP